MKTCPACKTPKPVGNFSRNQRERDGRATYCKKCANAKVRAWKQAHPERVKEYHQQENKTRRLRDLKHRYGLTGEQYHQMVERQNGRCAICAREKPLVVDHCHVTGAVRGLLCRGCNTALGFLEDDPGRMVAMIAYLTYKPCHSATK